MTPDTPCTPHLINFPIVFVFEVRLFVRCSICLHTSCGDWYGYTHTWVYPYLGIPILGYTHTWVYPYLGIPKYAILIILTILTILTILKIPKTTLLQEIGFPNSHSPKILRPKMLPPNCLTHHMSTVSLQKR